MRKELRAGFLVGNTEGAGGTAELGMSHSVSCAGGWWSYVLHNTGKCWHHEKCALLKTVRHERDSLLARQHTHKGCLSFPDRIEGNADSEAAETSASRL